ncbi:MAG: hypothetical protein JST84_09670 [Acidobacteria bacterium]|nr:hypothetical protein [Acidobacteriota bacterium]
MKIKWQLVGTFVLSCLLAFMLMSVNSCQRERRLTATQWQQMSQAAQAKFRACIPDTQPEGNVNLAVAEIRNEPEQFRVKVIAYAVKESVDFDLPQYSMSRGRWLINERFRSYVRDEQCNEYKLKDRTPTVGKVPDSGRIQIKPGEFYEFTLSYPHLSDEIRQGVIVYGNWVMPFVLK